MYASSVAEWRYGVRCAPCGGVGCARLWRAGEGAGAGESGAERGAGSRESTGQRDSIADGTALHRGRVGSRHFEESLSLLRLSFLM